MAGYPPLLSKIAALIKKSHNRIVSPETELLITAGATQGIYYYTSLSREPRRSTNC
jgi:methionine aminotransferase